MSKTAMQFKVIFDGANSVNQAQQTEMTDRNNVLQVSGLNSGDSLKFEVSIDGGTTWVEDQSLEFSEDGQLVLEKAAALIRAVVTGVADASNLKILLGY